VIDIRNILCPTDFSEFSRRAFDYAVAVARRYEATLTVMHVYPTIPVLAFSSGIPPLDPSVLRIEESERLLRELERFVAAAPAPGVRVETVIREGDAAGEILAAASAQKADLLAVGSHGRSGFERLLLGSVTEKLLRKAPCPVLTVPRRRPDAVPTAAHMFGRILCPIDFSDCSMAALRYATSLAEEIDGRLVVVYVVANDISPLPGQPPAEAIGATMSVAEFFIKREEAVRRMLEEAVPEGARTYCKVQTLLAHGKPASEILRLAQEDDTDLIVIGVHGRGAADLALFGSTTYHVLRQAVCPVLTIAG
jgi:nucleotide-binding universal stress UspA family protein